MTDKRTALSIQFFLEPDLQTEVMKPHNRALRERIGAAMAALTHCAKMIEQILGRFDDEQTIAVINVLAGVWTAMEDKFHPHPSSKLRIAGRVSARLSTVEIVVSKNPKA